MNCERLQEQIPDYLSGALDPGCRVRLLAHLDTCAACREDVTQIDAVWRQLELLPAAEPSAALHPRFQEMLRAYQAGLAGSRLPRRSWFALSLPTWAGAAVLLLIGVFVGRYIEPRKSELAQVKIDLENMRQLVALSMLQQQSPAARLRGVSFGAQMREADPQVESALLFAVIHDANVNVRLSALDALQKFAGASRINRALIEALPAQDSPLVQIEIIDLLVNRNESDAAPVLRRLATNHEVNPAVRQRAQWGLNHLGAA